jgi:translation initiation factor 1
MYAGRSTLYALSMPGLFDGTPLERPVTCEHCRKPLAECACPRNARGELCRPQDQQARVQRERRRGKFTTVILGLDPAATDIPALLKELRKRFATGGAIAGSKTEPTIELQGDHREPLVALLRERGYPAKPSGG